MNDCAMLTMSSIRSVQPQMFAMTDHLVGIERKHWQTLRDFYSPKSPETYLSYSLLDYYIRWSEREPESVDIVFYSLNGDWSDGSFVAIWELQNVRKRFNDDIQLLYYFNFQDRNVVYPSSLDVTHARLLRLLRTVDFTKGLYFRYVKDNASASLLEMIKLKNHILVGRPLNMMWYHLPQSKALSFEIT